LPNNYEKLDNFLEIRDFIIKETLLLEYEYRYYLIIDYNGSISSTYDKEILSFYDNIKNNNYVDNDIEFANSKEKSLAVTYYDNFDNKEIKYFDAEEIKTL
jgi:hypothetical protein